MYSYETLAVAIDRLGDLLGECREIRRQVENGGFGEQMLRAKLQEMQTLVANCSPLRQETEEGERQQSVQAELARVDAYVTKASQSLRENLVQALRQQGILQTQAQIQQEMERVQTEQEKLDILRTYAGMLS